MNRQYRDDYISFFENALEVDRQKRVFSVFRNGRGVVAKDVSVTFLKEDGSEAFTLADFAAADHKWYMWSRIDFAKIIQTLSEGKNGAPETLTVEYIVTAEGAKVVFPDLPTDLTPVFHGTLCWGNVDDCFAVCLHRDAEETDLRSAIGPAVSAVDDALFDRARDEALIPCGSKGMRLDYSWGKNAYTFEAKGEFSMSVAEHVFERKFHTRYGAINKNTTFPKPPSGWMTWYAVRFDACEEAVLENARKQREYFYDYGADTVWVDWEWYHGDFDYSNASEKIGFLSPDPVRYPNGLRYMSDEIRKLGFIPALWIAPTVEPTMTDTVKKYIDSVCCYDEKMWCGRYFFDVTDERIRDEWIPRAIEQVKKWGYDALKWDCIPATVQTSDRVHDQLKHPEISTTEALRAIFQKAREAAGKDFYMLSCAGGQDKYVLTFSDQFDGARIGNDIFEWSEFITDYVEAVLRYYPYHNTVMYCDADNVVLREEYNNFEQAKSRVSTVSLLGLPLTIGDDLRKLPMDRVDLIRRALPTTNAHPKDIRMGKHDGKRFLVNTAINLPFESWNVCSVTNLLETEASATVRMKKDLKLDAGEYLVFDYWNQAFLGSISDEVTLELPAMGTAVLSVRKRTGVPQILSTSRHVTQGVVDLEDVAWNGETCTLSIQTSVVKNDPYQIFVYVPDGFTTDFGEVRDHVLTVKPDTTENKTEIIKLKFDRA